jgi:uncharacterized protein (PEP-CTERM system associated)
MAQGAEFHGGLKVGVLDTDNVFLAAAPNEVDETVFQVSPSLDFDYENQRISTTIRYQFDWYDYSDLNTSNEYHRYDATFTGELVPDTFFVEVGGSRSQSIVDPDAIIPSNGLPISGNLADRDEYYFNPRFEKALGRFATVRADYRYADVDYDESDFEETAFVQDNVNESANFEIQNYAREEGFTWALRYEWNETEYDLSLPWEYQQASAEIGAWVNGSTRIFASGGKESAWDDPIDTSLQDAFWEAGFAYRNGDKLSAEFAAGERSFGSSWRGQVDYSFRRGELSFSYADTPTTTGLDRYSRGNLLDPQEPNDLLTRPGVAERYILERGQASLTFEFRATTLGFIAYDENRTGRFTADGTPIGDESQQGVSVSFTWQLGARTELAASGSISNRETELGGKDDFITGLVSASYQFGSSLGLSLGYNYSEQDPDFGSGGPDYVANVLSLFLIYSF